ncbi:MAG: imelysin family protein [Bdellovibrionales bacterium]|nr:imelysin family protein [Bdellovibrionales bacterium]
MKLQSFLKLILVVSMSNLSSCSDYTSDQMAALPPAVPSKPGFGFQDVKNPLPANLQNPNEGEFSEEKMLVNIGINIIAKNVREFNLQAALLKSRLSDYCDELENGVVNAASETAVKNQWTQAMLAYHLVDAAPIGPLTDNGRYYADNIYSWPFINTCSIDNDVATLALTKQQPLLTINNRKGLGALEYLLFTPPQSEKCNLKIPLNKNVVEWLKRTPQQRTKDRCDRALALADDVYQKSQELWAAWDPENANFTRTLVENSPGARYPSAKAAVNALTDSLFSIEKIKDSKLGVPLGKNKKECIAAEQKCPDAVEHIWSGLAFPAISTQLAGFRAILYGSTNKSKKAFGFDDYLATKGHPEVVAKMDSILLSNIDEVQKVSQQGNLWEQILKMDVGACAATTIDNPVEPLCHLYANIRSVANTFKIDVLTILSLDAPLTHQGDND